MISIEGELHWDGMGLVARLERELTLKKSTRAVRTNTITPAATAVRTIVDVLIS